MKLLHGGYRIRQERAGASTVHAAEQILGSQPVPIPGPAGKTQRMNPSNQLKYLGFFNIMPPQPLTADPLDT
jgi:hypothetical protein